METANTILQQLGGRQFVMMTGAKCYADGNTLVVKFKGSRIANIMYVSLNERDTYDVRICKYKGSDVRTVEEVNGVYCDNLRDTFERVTGLRTTLFGSLGSALRPAAFLLLLLLGSCGPVPAQQSTAEVKVDSIHAVWAAGIGRGVTASEVAEALSAPTWTAPDGSEYIVHQGPRGGYYCWRTSKKTGAKYKVYLKKTEKGFSTHYDKTSLKRVN